MSVLKQLVKETDAGSVVFEVVEVVITLEAFRESCAKVLKPFIRETALGSECGAACARQSWLGCWHTGLSIVRLILCVSTKVGLEILTVNFVRLKVKNSR